MKNKLPILATFAEALTLSYNNYLVILRVGLPLIIVGGLFILYSYFSISEELNSLTILIYVLFAVAFVLSLVMAVVGCHRIFLLESHPAGDNGFINWTGTELKYIGWWILICILAVIVSIPLGMIIAPIFGASVTLFFDTPLVAIFFQPY